MSKGAARQHAASINESGSESALQTMVPEFDHPIAHSDVGCIRARIHAVAVRTSSTEPCRAEKNRGDVTGEPPQLLIFKTPTRQPLCTAAAAWARTYVSCDPPPKPLRRSRNGLSSFSTAPSTYVAPVESLLVFDWTSWTISSASEPPSGVVRRCRL